MQVPLKVFKYMQVQVHYYKVVVSCELLIMLQGVYNCIM